MKTQEFALLLCLLPALLRAEKLVKKARRSKVLADDRRSRRRLTRTAAAGELFELASVLQSCGWSAEELLGDEIQRLERQFRRREKAGTASFRS